MRNNKINKLHPAQNAISSLTWLLAGVTLVVIPEMADPFNSPKFILLALISSWFLGHLIDSYRTNKFPLKSAEAITLFLAIFFLTSMLISVFFTKPLLIGLIGETQRRNGFLFYFSSLIIFLYISRVSSFDSIIKVFKVIILTAAILSIYGLIQISGNDFIDWVNPYNKMISTLGNPNFASALLAVFAVFLFYGLFLKSLTKIYKLFSIVVCVMSFVCIVISDSRQGILVFIFASLFFIAFFMINKKNYLKLLIIPGTIFIFMISIFGMLQKGPLASLLYKDSVSVRGYYWRAGIEMLKANFFTGVGIDRYEPYFKLYREPGYALKYGYEIGSSNAHNVVIQLFATGGVFVGTAYLLIIGFVFIRGIGLLRRTSGENQLITLIIFSAWIGFQSQTFISIDNIGISVWGWLLSGLIIGLAKSQQKINEINTFQKAHSKNLKNENISLLQPIASIVLTVPVLVLSIFLVRAKTDLYTLKSIISAPSEQNKPYGFSYAFKVLNNPLADSNYRFDSAMSLIKLGYIQEGNEAFNSLFNSDPNNLLYLNILANNEEKNKNLESAIKFRKEISKLDPWNVENKVKLSKLYLEVGNFIDAKLIKDDLVAFAENKIEVIELIDLIARK